jgi:hypothetical protein
MEVSNQLPMASERRGSSERMMDWAPIFQKYWKMGTH